MEPFTHFLVGACIGRAAFNRKTAYATLTAVLAAESLDMDELWQFAGPVEGLKHHRGITHTFIGVPAVAAIVVLVVALLRLVLERRRQRRGKPEGQRVSWGWLYLTSLVAAFSHLLLDWTNNYGVRPFFPFNPRWYAGSFVFIAEPIFWVVLILALVMPWLFGLADREIGAKRVKFRGRGWAIFALSSMVVVWCWRWSEHAKGLALINNTQLTPAAVTRVALEPYPVNPFRWHAILETANYFMTAEVNTRTGEIDSDPRSDILYKPADTPAMEAAKQTRLGKVYLDWGRWAAVRDLGQQPAPGIDAPRLPAGRTWTTVELTDLRFDYAVLGIGQRDGPPPLGGWVYIVDGREDAGESLGGREQR